MLPKIYETNNYFNIEESGYLSKLNSYRELKDGWCRGEGYSPDKSAINQAIGISDFAKNRFLAINTAVGLEGEIQLALFRKSKKVDKYIEITIEKEGPYNLTEFQLIDDCYEITRDEEVYSLPQLKTEISKFSRELFSCQNLSGFYQSNIFIKTWEDSPAPLLKTIEEESRLYACDASVSWGQLCVGT